MGRQQTIIVIAVSMQFLLISCTRGNDEILRAQQSVLEFRELIARGDFREIYQQSSAAFKESAAQNDFIEGVRKWSSEIGNSSNFDIAKAQIREDMFGKTLVTLTYQAKPSIGANQETYVFVKEGNELRLYSYSIR